MYWYHGRTSRCVRSTNALALAQIPPHVPLPSCSHVDGGTPLSRRQPFQQCVALAPPLKAQHSPRMRTLCFSFGVSRHMVRMGGATLVSPILMPLRSTTFSLQNTSGHRYWLYECPTVLPTIVVTTACRTIVATCARWLALYCLPPPNSSRRYWRGIPGQVGKYARARLAEHDCGRQRFQRRRMPPQRA